MPNSFVMAVTLTEERHYAVSAGAAFFTAPLSLAGAVYFAAAFAAARLRSHIFLLAATTAALPVALSFLFGFGAVVVAFFCFGGSGLS